MTMTRGAHTFKFGGEYRQHRVEVPVPRQHRDDLQQHQRLHRQPAGAGGGGARLAVLHAAAVLRRSGSRRTPGASNSRLTLELGLRYDFYSVVKEKDDLAKPFFIEDNAFAANDATASTTPTRTTSRRGCRPSTRSTPKTALRAGYGHFYGPGQFEDRIQPIENYIERRRVAVGRRAQQRAGVSGRPLDLSQPALGSRLHARPPRRVQRAVRRQRRARAARRST